MGLWSPLLPPLEAQPVSSEGAIALHDLLREQHCLEVPVACYEGRLWVRLSAQMYNSVEDYEVLAGAVQALRA